MIKKLFARYRYSVILLRELVKTDFKLRYQGSILGYAWSLLRPLLLFVILYIVFAVFLKVGDNVPHFPVYLLVGILLWNYFIEITTGNVGAVVGKGDLLRKISFPKYIVVLAGCASAVINLLLNTVVVAVFMVVTGVTVSSDVWLVIPLLLELTVLALGIGFFLSALFVRFRDVSYIWEVITQAAFYATPILYPLTQVPLQAQKYMILNPVAQVIQDVRHVLVTPVTTTVGNVWDPIMYLVPIGITVVVAITGGLYFRKRSRYFAEEV